MNYLVSGLAVFTGFCQILGSGWVNRVTIGARLYGVDLLARKKTELYSQLFVILSPISA
ncbi:hypothetical protein [Ekhidna sp. MALMAid0563]|uniref:hypothetical protein n=1 Tax=Ekhidna sp. MALMAid0563 TaxID=3143937 RepID=UPI0032DFF5D9